MIERIETTARLSKALVCGEFLFTSGLTAKDKSLDVYGQTKDVLDQIDSYLAAAGTDKRHLLSVNIWLVDIADFAQMNRAWEEWVDADALPARATVQSALAGKGAHVEIQAQAVRPPG